MQCKTRLGWAMQDKARLGKARLGKASQGKARLGKASQGKARQGKARLFNVPVTRWRMSGTDLLRQLYLLPHSG